MCKYRVVWVDDKIVSIYDQDSKDLLEECGLEVVATKDTGDTFIEWIRTHRHMVDAVVTDANFGKLTNDGISERNTSGLNTVLSELDVLKDELPLFILTGRSEELLKEQLDGKIWDFLRSNNRIFYKGNEAALWDSIKALLDSHQSQSWHTYCRYKTEIDAIDSFGLTGLGTMCTENLNGKEWLLKELIDIEKDELGADLISRTGKLRGVLEKLMTKLRERGLLPEWATSSLSDQLKVLNDKDAHNYKLSPYMQAVSSYFNSIVNDVNHDKENLQLHSRDYIIQYGGHRLYISLLYAFMDMIVILKDVYGDNESWEEPVERKYNDHFETKTFCIEYWTGPKHNKENTNKTHDYVEVGDMVVVKKTRGRDARSRKLVVRVLDYDIRKL